jgi:NAD(P)-dependent dehydrogenase (short-subunit alcohol dehydrogenase family)
MAHRMGHIDFEDMDWRKRKYNTQRAYSDSKIANLYFTYELARRSAGDDKAPMATAAHPGWTGTDLQRHAGFFRFLNPVFGQGPEMGILPSLRAAFDPQAKPADYFGPSRLGGMRGNPVKIQSNERSHDQDAARKLWELSEEKTGVKF